MNNRTTSPLTQVYGLGLTTPSSLTSLDVLKYGDGGVDVTGVLNCRLAEGAMKHRKRKTFFEKLILTCWELHFFTYRRLKKYASKIVDDCLRNKKCILFKQNVTYPKVERLYSKFGRDIGHFFHKYCKCFFNINISTLSLTFNFTILLSTKIDDFLTLDTQSGEVCDTSDPEWLVPSFRDLSQVSLAGQPTENNIGRAMVLFYHPLWRVFGKSKIQILQLFTDTWQSNCARMLKSRKDTPRNFLKYVQSAAIFLGAQLAPYNLRDKLCLRSGQITPKLPAFFI